jgi:hypothetical protein
MSCRGVGRGSEMAALLGYEVDPAVGGAEEVDGGVKGGGHLSVRRMAFYRGVSLIFFRTVPRVIFLSVFMTTCHS